MAIILVLAGLVLGPATRALKRVRADKWGEESAIHLHATMKQLQKQFQGNHDFALVTLETLETNRWLDPAELDFLKDRRVTFSPFGGSDPSEKVVIRVVVDQGFWTDAGVLVERKGAITDLP